MYNIRLYNSKDLESILNIFDLNTPEYFSPNEKNDLINYLINFKEDYFVFTIENEVVGAGGINYKENREVACISWDLIHPDYHGRGLGRKLLDYRINHIKKQNIKLITVRTSQLAYLFYQKNGFKLIETVKDYWDKGYDLYRMEYVFSC